MLPPIAGNGPRSNGGQARAAFRRHAKLTLAVGAVIVAIGAYGAATGARLTVPYLTIVVAGAVLVARVEPLPPGGFSRLTLAGLSAWAIGHMAGGTIGIGDGRTLYNAVVGNIHVDNIVHFVGFGSAGLAWWEAWSARNNVSAPTPASVAVAVWLAGMGVGALNEVVEFFTTLVVEDTNVGGYQNTGRDLVANMLGAATAAVIAARRRRRV